METSLITDWLYFKFDSNLFFFPSLPLSPLTFFHGERMCSSSLLVGKAFDGQKLFQSSKSCFIRFKQRAPFLRVIFKPWGYIAAFPLFLLNISIFSFPSPLCLLFRMFFAIPASYLLAPPHSRQCSPSSTLVTAVCVWSSCARVRMASAGKWKHKWGWESAFLWVCSMYCSWSICPKFLAGRQCWSSW